MNVEWKQGAGGKGGQKPGDEREGQGQAEGERCGGGMMAEGGRGRKGGISYLSQKTNEKSFALDYFS